MNIGPLRLTANLARLLVVVARLSPQVQLAAQPSVVCKTSADQKTTECVPRTAPDAPAARPPAPTSAANPVQLYLARLMLPRDPRSARMGNLGQFLGQMPGGSVSLTMLEQTLAIDRQAGDPKALVADLALIAGVHLRSGNYPAARQRLDEAHGIALKLGQPDALGAVLMNLGVLAALTGDYATAIRQTEQARQQYDRAAETAKPSQPGAPSARGPMADMTAGGVDTLLRNMFSAQGADIGRETARLNLAALYAVTGRFEDAAKQYDQALLLYGQPGRSDSPAEGSGTILQAKANMLRMAGRLPEADQVERLANAAGESLIARLALTGDAPIELQSASATKAGAVTRPGFPVVEADLTNLSRATATSQLAVFQNEAAKHAAAGNLDSAAGAWRQAAAMAEILGAASAVSGALAELQAATLAQGQVELSIYYGKRTVNELQAQRERMGELGRDERNAFAARARRVYETLAAALLDANRLSEAEQALKLLREDASADFLRISGRMPYTLAETALLNDDRAKLARWKAAMDAWSAQRAASVGGALSFSSAAEADAVLQSSIDLADQLLSSAERAASGRDAQAQAMMPMLQQQVDELTRVDSCAPGALSPRIQQLSARLKKLQQSAPSRPGPVAAMPALVSPAAAPGSMAAREAWCHQRSWITNAEQIAAAEPALAKGLTGVRPAFSGADAQLLDGGQQALASAAAGTVALQYLSTPNRLWLLLTGPRSRVARPYNIERKQLDAMADGLRQALQDQRVDPRRPALELYRVLISPVQDELQRLNARTLLLSLDGRMRYVPFAALHDGERWLVETWATALGGPSRPTKGRPRREWQVAGFGASADTGSGLMPLAAVARELAYVVKDRAAGTGALPGVAVMNASFTASALRSALAKAYPVIHIASHFVLKEDDRSESYLLLGDGSRLTLKALREGYRFDGVELLTLSACDTGRDMRNAWGQEFEGLSNLMRGQGASSVLATLWPVVDDTTAAFMKSFYELMIGRDSVTKAQAIQSVQTSMLRTVAPATPAPNKTRSGSFGALDAASSADSMGRAHPYFWAPFVLMGDWQ